MTIVSLDKFTDLRPQIIDIFFETAAQTVFQSDKERDKFRKKWLDPYLFDYPENVFLFLQNGIVAGYLTGLQISCVGLDHFKTIGYYEELYNEYFSYPAHFHINVSFSFQKQGIGRLLVQAFINECLKNNIRGINIVTGYHASNKLFYISCGFQEIKSFFYNNKKLVMLGKTI